MSNFQTAALLVWAAGVVMMLVTASEWFQWAKKNAAEDGEIHFTSLFLASLVWPCVVTDMVLMFFVGAIVIFTTDLTDLKKTDLDELADWTTETYGWMTCCVSSLMWGAMAVLVFG